MSIYPNLDDMLTDRRADKCHWNTTLRTFCLRSFLWMDRWEQSGYYCEEDQQIIDSVYKELEGSVDRFYDNMEKKKKQQPVAEWTD